MQTIMTRLTRATGTLAVMAMLTAQAQHPLATSGPPPRRDIDLAICLDTSGSMRGLLDSARQSIWAIANDLALAKPMPNLRIALLTFGNDGHQAENGWVRVDTGFTQDLDLVSQKLFALTTNGGTELVGRVLQASLERLQWTNSADALKLIVVAGNESADQDKMVPFADQCRAAIGRGIMINSIYCGNPSDNIAPGWSQVAKLADGHFHAIDQHGTVALKTPFDAQMAGLSASLNGTYIPVGTAGQRGSANQTLQDSNAVQMNGKAATQRAQAKCTSNYFCSWDLVDALNNKTLTLDKVKAKDLPANMREMSLAERQRHVDEMSSKRGKIQAQIKGLHGKREAWTAAERKRRQLDRGTDFESAVRRAVRGQAAGKGLRFEPPARPATAPVQQVQPSVNKPTTRPTGKPPAATPAAKKPRQSVILKKC